MAKTKDHLSIPELTPKIPGSSMFHAHHIWPTVSTRKEGHSSHPGQLHKTHCVQCIESSVIPRCSNAAILCGASVTHACKCRHAPWKTGGENISTAMLTLNYQSTCPALTHVQLCYSSHASSALRF